MAPPGAPQLKSFARNPEEPRSGSKEEEPSDLLRRQHYESRRDFYTTQLHRDPTQETVIKKLENGFRKMKITVTDENHLSTTVFMDEAAALELIDFLAENVLIRSTRSGQGWRAYTKQTPAVNVAKQSHREGSTENTPTERGASSV